MREHKGEGALVTVIVVVLIYLAIWVWCKMTGQKAEFES